MGVNHYISRFLWGAVGSISIFEDTLFYLIVPTECFLEFSNLFVGHVVCYVPPVVDPFDFPTMSLECSTGGIVIIPCVSGWTYGVRGEAPPSL